MNAKVSVIMGSRSDWGTMEHSVKTLQQLGIPFKARILSAHRTPGALEEHIAESEAEGVLVYIAAAGMSAHLAGVVASKTERPVLGVPMETKSLGGMDSLLSTVQMPAGIPVGTLAIGKAGAINAALFAASIVATNDPELGAAIHRFREEQTAKILADSDPLQPPPE